MLGSNTDHLRPDATVHERPHVSNRPAAAANIKVEVAHPRVLSVRPFTRGPMIARLPATSMMTTRRGGARNPFRTAVQNKAEIGFTPARNHAEIGVLGLRGRSRVRDERRLSRQQFDRAVVVGGHRVMKRAHDCEAACQASLKGKQFTEVHPRDGSPNRTERSAIFLGSAGFRIPGFKLARPAPHPEQDHRCVRGSGVRPCAWCMTGQARVPKDPARSPCPDRTRRHRPLRARPGRVLGE